VSTPHSGAALWTAEGREELGLVAAVPSRLEEIALLDEQERTAAAALVAGASALQLFRPAALFASWLEDLHNGPRSNRSPVLRHEHPSAGHRTRTMLGMSRAISAMLSSTWYS
jgi:hypothetical protein